MRLDKLILLGAMKISITINMYHPKLIVLITWIKDTEKSIFLDADAKGDNLIKVNIKIDLYG